MVSSSKLLFILPSYGQFDYVRQTLHSFFEHSPDSFHAVIVDDASPETRADLSMSLVERLCPEQFHHRCTVVYFSQNGGLTRSWNAGLRLALAGAFEYAVCGNSDLLFSPNWYEGLFLSLDQGFHLVGPISNCPGAPQYGKQRVTEYRPQYEVTDDRLAIAQLADGLREEYIACGAHVTIEDHINGFFMIAKTATWWQGAFDPSHVFNPCNTHTSKGQRNPTPLMTLNEDELQRRWREKGWKIGFTPSSFIFHYRAVSRGSRFQAPGWYRKPAEAGGGKG